MILKNLIRIALKVCQTSNWMFCLSCFGLLIINLSGVPVVWGQIPVEINSVPTTINRPTLKIGSQGEEVSELQGVLKLLGYYFGAVDGVYSESTATAVIKFQEVAGLMPNGIVDRNTWNRLLPSAPTSNSTAETETQDIASNCDCTQNQSSPPTANVAKASEIDSDLEPSRVDFPILKIGMRGNAVRGLQERLKAKGFLRGRVDGVFGPQTQTAVKAAQRKYQLQPDGVVDTSLWMALLR